MSSPQISLYYQKITDNSCLIIEKEEAYQGYPNSDLELRAYQMEAMTSCLHFLCELLEKNSIDSRLLQLIKKDMMLNVDESVSQKYMSELIVQKYVQDLKIESYNPASCYLSDLPIGEEQKEKLRVDIMNANVPESSNVLETNLFDVFDDEEGKPLFNLDVLRNLQRLEKYMTLEQIMEIRPGYTFKLILKDNYLANIESLPRIESALDTWICEWLDK